MQYRYWGCTQTGARVRGTVDAPDRATALDAALENAYIVTRLQVDIPEESLWHALTRERGKPKLIEVALFFRQLAGAAAAGVPIARALELQRDSSAGRMHELLRAMHAAVIAGSSVSAALDEQGVFPPLAVRAVRAGEAAGDLPGACQRVAAQIESDITLRGKVLRAMIYPAIVVVLLLVGGGVLAGFVFPRILEMFKGLNINLPLPTLVMISVSDWLQAHWAALGAGVALSVAGTALFLHSRPGAHLRDQLVWTAPLLRRVARSSAAARFLRTLATLLRTGTPINETLDLVVSALGNRFAEAHLASVIQRVLDGADLAATVASAGILPPMASAALTTGAATGTLADAADQAAKFYEEDADTALGVLTEAMTPLVTVLVALGVLFMALSVYLPMAAIVKNVQ